VHYTLTGSVNELLHFTVIAAKTPQFGAKELVNDSITIEASPGLVFFSSASETTPATRFALVNGRADIWVTSLSPIDDGRIIAARTVAVSSNPGSRGGITFERSAIKEAFFYTSKGTGSVDSVVIIYSDTIAYPPDKVDLYWPSRADDPYNKRTITRTAPGQNVIQLLGDSVTVTIKLAIPYPEEVTTGTMTQRLGTTYYTDNGVEASSDFRIKDGVGPLIDSAWVVERTDPGIDTLIVLFTEDILENLQGSSLQLIQYDTTVLAVAFAEQIGPRRFKLALAEGQRAPKQGDKLRIEPTGPVADIFANKAHQDNRPVIIGIVATPAKIVHSYYRDIDGNGVPDTAIVVFSKNVDLNGLWLQIDPGLGFTSDPEKVGGTVLNNVAGISLRLIVPDTMVNTSGIMYVTADYEEFYGSPNTAPDMMHDSVAPVIKSATYLQGEENQPDTLEVTFSEYSVLPQPLPASPFLFSTADGTQQYAILVEGTPRALTSATIRFAVDTIVGVMFPQKGDLIWINNEAGIRDSLNNVQSNPNNRKVPMDIRAVRYTIEVAISQNPFQPGMSYAVPEGGPVVAGTRLLVVPKTKNIHAISISARVKILDAVGNVVMDQTDMPADELTKRPTLVWNGTNRNGRYVGTGTYLAIFSLKESNKELSPVRLRIGVKR
jgi:hypothetical protein